MEHFLIIIGGMRLVGRGSLRGQIDLPPDLGFEYDGLHYEPEKGIVFKLLFDDQTGLLGDEIRAIEAYIDAFRFRVWLLGKDGLPYAQVYEDEATTPYAHCLPPNLPENYWYNPASAQWDIIYGVNDAGEYIGNVPFAQCACVANCRPSFDYERWDDLDQEWFDARDMSQMQWSAKETMRQTANSAKGCGIIFNGNFYGSTIEDYDSYTNAKLKEAVVKYWDACEDRYSTACIEIDTATSAEDIDKVLF
jgi:hypothetical protein